MGLPLSLAGFLPGLFQLGAEKPGCKNAALGMALWAFQAHPLAPGLAPWGIRAVNEGLRVNDALARTMLLPPEPRPWTTATPKPRTHGTNWRDRTTGRSSSAS